MTNLPKILYRAFSSEKYAREFINKGRFRLRLIDQYVTIKDKKRVDQTEGKSSSYINSTNAHVVGFFVDHLYLLCTSGEEVDLNFLRTFGSFIVRINDPLALLEDIQKVKPVNTKMEITQKCKIEKVLYTKGQVEDFDPDSMEAIKRTFSQKPPSYQNECEYRFIVTTRPLIEEFLDDFIFYDLNHKIEYLDLI